MRHAIHAFAMPDFEVLGRQNEEQAVYLLQALLLDEKACRLRIAWLREAGRQARARFPDLKPSPRPEFLDRVLAAVDEPGIIAAWREGKVTFAELEALTRAPRALYEAHCRLLEREPEVWPGEVDVVTEVELSSEVRSSHSETQSDGSWTGRGQPRSDVAGEQGH